VGQVWNTGGAISSTGGANVPPVNQLKCPDKNWYFATCPSRSI